jgi:hypothetical protein
MKRIFTIEKLASPEHYGDWHDKPLRWLARCASEGGWSQKFSTRKNAELWARIAKKSVTFNEAQSAYQAA